MTRNPWVTGMIFAVMGYALAELAFAPEKRESGPPE